MGCHVLLQGISPAQGLKLHLLHWQVDALPVSHQGSSTSAAAAFVNKRDGFDILTILSTPLWFFSNFNEKV